MKLKTLRRRLNAQPVRHTGPVLGPVECRCPADWKQAVKLAVEGRTVPTYMHHPDCGMLPSVSGDFFKKAGVVVEDAMKGFKMIQDALIQFGFVLSDFMKAGQKK